jgi:hypothetical protein
VRENSVYEAIAGLARLFPKQQVDALEIAALEDLSRAKGLEYPPLFWSLANAVAGSWIYAAGQSRRLANVRTFDEYRLGVHYCVENSVPVAAVHLDANPIFDLEDGSYDVLASDGRVVMWHHEFQDDETLAPTLQAFIELLWIEANASVNDALWAARGVSRSTLRRARGTHVLEQWPPPPPSTRSLERIGQFVEMYAHKRGPTFLVRTTAEVERGDVFLSGNVDPLLVLEVQITQTPFDPPPPRQVALLMEEYARPPAVGSTVWFDRPQTK